MALVDSQLVREAIAHPVGSLQETAAVERMQDPEAHALAETGATHDVAEPKDVATVVERV